MSQPLPDTAHQTGHPWVATGRGQVRFGIDVDPALEFAASVAWAQLVEALGFHSF